MTFCFVPIYGRGGGTNLEKRVFDEYVSCSTHAQLADMIGESLLRKGLSKEVIDNERGT